MIDIDRISGPSCDLCPSQNCNLMCAVQEGHDEPKNEIVGSEKRKIKRAQGVDQETQPLSTVKVKEQGRFRSRVFV
jgi:hypothetical protein